MDRFTLDLQKLTVADPKKGVPVIAGTRRPAPSSERELIDKALDFGIPFNPDLKGLKEVTEIAKSPPAIVVLPSPAVPLFSSGAKRELTVALGFSGSVAFVTGVSIGGGIYGSSTGEIGVFATAGFMVGIVEGAGVGSELTFILGTPSDFAGVFVAVAVTVLVAPPLISVGGSLIFSPGPTTASGLVSLAFMGFSIRLTAGFSTLPFSAAIEWTDTAIKPLIRLR